MKKKTIEELGLTNETLFDAKIAMEYWLQKNTHEFLIDVTHEIRKELIAMKAFIEIISKDNQVSSLNLSSPWEDKTINDICAIILKQNDRASKVLDVMSRYAKEKVDNV